VRRRGESVALAVTIRASRWILNGRSQAVRLPSQFSFQGKEVFIRQDAATEEVILSERPESWEGFFKLRATTDIPDEFIADRCDKPPQKRKQF
jgi:antitoxin VapB